jgi:glyoxylase-like metal-dependent hydrolase (beta-lactamase superfamily II)
MKEILISGRAVELDLIKLDVPLEGFRNFIGCWILTADDLVILVDPGPRCTISVLMKALAEKSIKKIDYILLTHIHIDHAGGAGILLQQYPEARIICHPIGIRHLINPAKLWASSLKILGRAAHVYSAIEPVGKENIFYATEIKTKGITIQIHETPGHASHHLSYQIENILFAGEIAGSYYPLDNGFYLRPSTPPIFNGDSYCRSLEKIAALDISLFCFGHYDCNTNVKDILEMADSQFKRWMHKVEKRYWLMTEAFEEKIFAELLEEDKGLEHYHDLPPDIQAREKYFAFNSIRGMRSYLEHYIY